MRTLPLKRVVDPRRPITYGIVQAGPDFPGGVPYIRPVDMTEHHGVRDPNELRTTDPETARLYRRSSLITEDIVISIGPSYGKTMIVPEQLEGANLTQGTARVAAARGQETRFLMWALQSTLATSFWDAAVGGATFRALNLEPLSRTPIPSWSGQQQRRIADFLDRETARIDALIAKKRRLMETLKVRFVIQVGSFFSSCPSRLPLRRVVRRVQTGTTPSGEAADLIDDLGDVEWVTPADFAEWLGLRSAQRRVRREAIEKRYVPLFPAGSVLIVGIGATAGKVGFLDRAASSNQQVTCLVPNERMNGRLLAWQLSVRSSELRETAPFTTLPILNNDFLRTVPMNVPGQADQDALLARIDTLAEGANQSVKLLGKQIQLLEEHRQALITAAVAGEWRSRRQHEA